MTTAVPRLGVTFIPTIEPEKLKDFARVADDSGLDEIWLWEDCFKESGVAAAAAALAWTERIHVGSVAASDNTTAGVVCRWWASLPSHSPGFAQFPAIR